MGQHVLDVAAIAAFPTGRVTAMRDIYPLVVATPVLGLAAYCLAQIVVARLTPGRSPYHSLKLGFIGGLIVTLAVSGWAVGRMAIGFEDRIGFVVLNLFTYVALAFGYFNFVNLTVASLRIRLLEEIGEAGGALPATTLKAAYNSSEVVAIRLQRLVQGGHLVEKDGRLHSGRLPFLIVARIFDGLRWFILGVKAPRH
jgi:hypothetical protein